MPREAGIQQVLSGMSKNGAQPPDPERAIAADPIQPTCIAGPGVRRAAEAYVEDINDFVLRMEQSYARNTNILRTSQVILSPLAVIGTILLLRFFFLTVIRPVFRAPRGRQAHGAGGFRCPRAGTVAGRVRRALRRLQPHGSPPAERL